MIEVENLTVSFKKNEVLHQVCAKFPTGKITGIMGRNGSGKTVLLKAICGLVIPDNGNILIDKKSLTIRNAHQFPIGILIESPGFLPDYTGLQNLRLLASLTMKNPKQRAIEVMEIVGLDWKSRKKVKEYSLGMRQRLGIAQALLEQPDILILDEPMNGLDYEFIQKFKSFLKELCVSGKTIILASHYLDDLDELCDTIYKMDNGNISI